jgi:hypothetical protein
MIGAKLQAAMSESKARIDTDQSTFRWPSVPNWQ